MMAAYRTNPTWALLLGSDLPEGSEKLVLQMLGSVVSDFEHPLHEMIKRPTTGNERDLEGVMKVDDGDFHSITNSLRNDEVKLQLTEAVRGKVATGEQGQQEMSAKTVITRTLENHRRFFEEIEERSGDDIVKMIENNPRKDPYALMIVGIKTCIDSKISSKTKLSSLVDMSINVPLDHFLRSAGIVVPVDATINLGMIKKGLAEVFAKYSAKGERIFAIQYRRISIRSTIKLLPIPYRKKESKYGDLFTVPANRGLYGDAGDETDEDEDSKDSEKETKVLEFGDGLEKNLSRLGQVYIVEL